MKKRNVRELVLATLVALGVSIHHPDSALAQAPPPGLPDLVGALQATAGCLGVEAAQTASGKRVIFAWFENKQAVLNWYYSETHQKTMKTLLPTFPKAPKPLSEISDTAGPIMVVASLTLSDKPRSDATSLPFSQIAIELYGPLPGGVAFGGRFAPDALKVPGLREPAGKPAQPPAR